MESLTKTQLVLLTLLLSFVTSIATGIMTSSLLQKAPTNVTQTINRVVERTIEKVSDTTGLKEVQVVSEDDRVISAIHKNQSSLVRIRQLSSDGSTPFYAMGVIISKDGQIVAERTNNFTTQFPFSAVFPDGTIANLAIENEIGDEGVVLFKAANLPSSGVSVGTLSKATPRLGQTVIVLEGQNDNFTLVGRITNLSGGSTTSPSFIDTDLQGARGTTGAPIIDLSGEILGIRRSDTGSKATFSSTHRFLKSVR